MLVVVYHCPNCGLDFGRTEEFSHDHCFDEPEVRIEEKLCPVCVKGQKITGKPGCF